MKKLILLSLLSLFATTTFAQAPQKMSYQAVIRNASNVLVANTNVRMRISVLQGTATGTAVYVETQTATTNANGLVTVEIGGGTVVSGTIASIAWGSNAYFIKTETDPTGGTNYSIVGTSQFLSVPYALFASNSASSPNYWTAFGDNIRNNNIGKVGIGTGTAVPFSKFTVREDGNGISQENLNATTRVGFLTGQVSAWLQTYTNSDLNFATNDNPTPQMTLQKGTGNVGIGVTAPTEKLDVLGKTKTTNLQITNGAGAGKILSSDAAGNAAWQTVNLVENREFETDVAGLSTTVQNAEVDFPTTNVIVPLTGTYLITYYVFAKNNFSSYCANNCTDPKVYNTQVYLSNKTSNINYQTMDIDFSSQESMDVEGISTLTVWSLPSHQVSGSLVKTLPGGTQIGIKLRSFADPGATGSITISRSTVTLVRLY